MDAKFCHTKMNSFLANVMTTERQGWCVCSLCRLGCETRHSSDERRSSSERLVPDTFQEQHKGRPVVHDEDGEEDSNVDVDQCGARLHKGYWDGRQNHDTVRGNYSTHAIPVYESRKQAFFVPQPVIAAHDQAFDWPSRNTKFFWPLAILPYLFSQHASSQLVTFTLLHLKHVHGNLVTIVGDSRKSG